MAGKGWGAAWTAALVIVQVIFALWYVSALSEAVESGCVRGAGGGLPPAGGAAAADAMWVSPYRRPPADVDLFPGLGKNYEAEALGLTRAERTPGGCLTGVGSSLPFRRSAVGVAF